MKLVSFTGKAHTMRSLLTSLVESLRTPPLRLWSSACYWASSLLLVTLFTHISLFAQGGGATVQGQVKHLTGAPIAGATVVFEVPGLALKRSRSNKAGVYSLHNVAAGAYSVHVQAKGFQPFELRLFRVAASGNIQQDFTLDLAPVKQEIVVVSGDKPLSIEPESSASTIQLRGAGLSGLPDDPTDFAAAVQALAGPSALGPTDPQLFVNGFINNQMPPKENIREIRINDNPFSAENDRPATNRIEAETKAGGRQVHGEGYLNFDAGWWDSTNPFTRPLPPNPSKLYGANLGGPIGKKASFFLSAERTQINFLNAINATVLSPTLLPVPLVKSVPAYQKRLLFNPQLDLTLNKTNTLTARYSSQSYSLPDEGLSGSALPDSGYRLYNRQQTTQVSETAALTSQAVNVAKFQFIRKDVNYRAKSLTPGISVDQAFTSGSSSSALDNLLQNQWEMQNNFSNVAGSHAIRAGIRIRGETDEETLTKNFAGTFSFLADSGPALSADYTPLVNAQGASTTVPLSALERYRRTLLFQQQGLPPATIRTLGGGASSLTFDSGDPFANVRQYDIGVYLQDDWRLRPNFMLGLGLRYEKQTNLNDKLNLGPRISFAWSPFKATKNPHTVLRGGFGLFYDRLDASLVLQTLHSQRAHLHNTVSDPAVLDLFPVMSPTASLAASSVPADTLQMGHVQAPTTLQGMLSLEQQLPFKTRLALTFTEARTYHNLLLVDVTPFQQGNPRFLTFDSSGILTQRQLKVEVSNRLSKRVNLTADYVLNRASSDTDGTTNPAADPNSLSYELGRSEKDIRHNFTLTGSWDAPWGLRLSPFIVASSSRPFNIITGQYEDPDVPYTGRPILATDPNQPGVVVTQYGAFQLNPTPGQPVIARNFAQGPAFFSASFRLSKTFGFGETSSDAQNERDTSSNGGGSRYRIVVSAQAVNVTNHLNAGVPEGNLSSSQFGQANTLAPGFNFGGGAAVYPRQLQANRRIELQLRLTF